MLFARYQVIYNPFAKYNLLNSGGTIERVEMCGLKPFFLIVGQPKINLKEGKRKNKQDP